MTEQALASRSEALSRHYPLLVRAIAEGRVIPFLGAGVNLSGRPPDVSWELGQASYLPNGVELARYIAENYDYQSSDKDDLLRVAQYVVTMGGEVNLYLDLRGIFNADYPPTNVHQFFAALPARLRAKGCPRNRNPWNRRLLIVTTNYDDLLEKAFTAAEQPYHLVWYMAGERHPDRGKFLHCPPGPCPPGAEAIVVRRPEEYQGLDDEIPVILKVHGAMDPKDEERDSYVITEDDYIDYLTRTEVESLLPNPLPAQLQRSRFLFLGYSLRDWNLRAIVHRLWRARRRSDISWAILKDLHDLERRFWLKRDIEAIEADLQPYFEQLTEHLMQYLDSLPELPAETLDGSAQP